MSRIGIFGGSFNPIHLAHLILAERARVERALDTVLFVPAAHPPHKPPQSAGVLAPAERRLRMVELAVEGNPGFEASSLELEREGPSYTLLTVRQVRQRRGPEAELFLVMGADSVLDVPNWWHAEELAREAEVIALERPGFALDEGLEGLVPVLGERWVRRVGELRVRAPLLGISATEIRRRLAAGESVRYMVPAPVLEYISAYGLYGAR